MSGALPRSATDLAQLRHSTSFGAMTATDLPRRLSNGTLAAKAGAMDAAALQKRAKRFRELVDGMIRESALARGRKLGLTRQEILEYSLLLVEAVSTLGDASRLMEKAAARVQAAASEAARKPQGGR
jgi:hypothetical protein